MNRRTLFSRLLAAAVPALFAKKLLADRPGVGGSDLTIQVDKPMFRSMGVEYLSAGRSTRPIQLYSLIRHNTDGRTYMVTKIWPESYMLDGKWEPLLSLHNVVTSHTMAMPQCWIKDNFHVIGAAMPERNEIQGQEQEQPLPQEEAQKASS